MPGPQVLIQPEQGPGSGNLTGSGRVDRPPVGSLAREPSSELAARKTDRVRRAAPGWLVTAKLIVQPLHLRFGARSDAAIHRDDAAISEAMLQAGKPGVGSPEGIVRLTQRR